MTWENGDERPFRTPFFPSSVRHSLTSALRPSVPSFLRRRWMERDVDDRHPDERRYEERNRVDEGRGDRQAKTVHEILNSLPSLSIINSGHRMAETDGGHWRWWETWKWLRLFRLSSFPYPSPSDPVSLASGGSDGDGSEGKDTDKLRSWGFRSCLVSLPSPHGLSVHISLTSLVTTSGSPVTTV